MNHILPVSAVRAFQKRPPSPQLFDPTKATRPDVETKPLQGTWDGAVERVDVHCQHSDQTGCMNRTPSWRNSRLGSNRPSCLAFPALLLYSAPPRPVRARTERRLTHILTHRRDRQRDTARNLAWYSTAALDSTH